MIALAPPEEKKPQKANWVAQAFELQGQTQHPDQPLCGSD